MLATPTTPPPDHGRTKVSYEWLNQLYSTVGDVNRRRQRSGVVRCLVLVGSQVEASRQAAKVKKS